MLTLQVLINGILLGGLYGIMALGMSLIWGVMNIVNIAHGALIMLGAYITFWTFTLWGWDPFLSLPVTILLLFGYGYLLQRFILNLIVRAQLFLTLLITFGVEVAMVNLARILWSSDLRQVTPRYAGANFAVAGVTIPYVRLWVFATTVVLSVLFLLLLEHTRLGRAIRATAEELRAARLTGIPVGHIYAVTYGLGAALAGAAGAMWGMLFPVTPIMGGPLTLKSFVVAVLGGLGTMMGSIVGGLVLGLAESFSATYLGPTYPNAISFGLLVLILILRPAGILGRRERA
ncbi:MAG TPA: branched-chain amino acid ABC transporter permease [Candidatus Methylomirabilis sp.]|nr:branched-chain amino acid ABC transporter permease [Candidatus Methylomirabilis sp.]HSC72247.1 branched-chain amino acid ABC transporter permease [Candidatus Methylomirabilis sp.]